MSTFGELLRRHRTAAGLSQEELAERSRLSSGGVSALERGVRRRAYRETVGALAEALALTGSDLAEFTNAALHGRGSANSPALKGHERPPALPALIGRDFEVQKIFALFEMQQMVTIDGPGGIGKTTVALAVASSWEKHTETRFVDLAPLVDGAYVAQSIAATFDTALRGRDDTSALCALLRPKSALVILDNCEHVLYAVAKVVSAVLRECPNIRILCTSRERIGVAGEAVYQLQPLALASGVQLFEDRVGRVDPSFRLDHKRRVVASEICAALDNMPLAITIAAAQAAILGLENVRARLKHAGLFTTEQASPRHRSISAAIQWSVELLRPADQSLLYRLSVFSSTFSLDDAERVCSLEGGRDAVAPAISRLASKSLVTVNRSLEPHTFRLLEPIRAFSKVRLSESEEFEATLNAHAEWLAEIGMNASARSAGLLTGASFFDLQSLQNDLRAAVDWTLDPRCKDPSLAANIVGHFRHFWITKGSRRECRRYGLAALQKIDNTVDSSVLAALFKALIQCTKGDEMFELANRAIPVFERANDRGAIRALQAHLIYELAKLNRLDEAEDVTAAAEQMFAPAECRRDSLYALFLHNRGHLRIAQCRWSEAELDLLAASGLYEQLSGDAYVPGVVIGLAELCHQQGETARAALYGRRAREHGRVGDVRFAHLVEAAYRLELTDIRGAASVAKDGLSIDAGDSIESTLLIHIVAALSAQAGAADAAATLAGFVDASLQAENYVLDFPHTHVRNRLNSALSNALPGYLRFSLEQSGRALGPVDAAALAEKLLREHFQA